MSDTSDTSAHNITPLVAAEAPQRSIVLRMLDHVFPQSPDFFSLLAEQAVQVQHTTTLLVAYMQRADPRIAEQIKQDEHTADRIKVRNIHTLNEAFSTPIDREDIYRAIMDMDMVVNYCKDTVSEMDILGVAPDTFTLEMAELLSQGMQALADGFVILGSKTPSWAAEKADQARKAERRVEKRYRHALAELFQGEDYLNMFKRREVYRHLSHGAERMAHCANTLHDIVVKLV